MCPISGRCPGWVIASRRFVPGFTATRPATFPHGAETPFIRRSEALVCESGVNIGRSPTAASSSSNNLSLSAVPVIESGAAGRERRLHDGPSPAEGDSAVIRLVAAGSTHARVIRISARRFFHFSIFTPSCCGRSLFRVSPSADSASASELNSDGFVPRRWTYVALPLLGIC